MAQSLKNVLAYDGDVENDLCLSFEVPFDYFGESRCVGVFSSDGIIDKGNNKLLSLLNQGM